MLTQALILAIPNYFCDFHLEIDALWVMLFYKTGMMGQ